VLVFFANVAVPIRRDTHNTQYTIHTFLGCHRSRDDRHNLCRYILSAARPRRRYYKSAGGSLQAPPFAVRGNAYIHNVLHKSTHVPVGFPTRLPTLCGEHVGAGGKLSMHARTHGSGRTVTVRAKVCVCGCCWLLSPAGRANGGRTERTRPRQDGSRRRPAELTLARGGRACLRRAERPAVFGRTRRDDEISEARSGPVRRRAHTYTEQWTALLLLLLCIGPAAASRLFARVDSVRSVHCGSLAPLSGTDEMKKSVEAKMVVQSRRFV